MLPSVFRRTVRLSAPTLKVFPTVRNTSVRFYNRPPPFQGYPPYSPPPPPSRPPVPYPPPNSQPEDRVTFGRIGSGSGRHQGNRYTYRLSNPWSKRILIFAAGGLTIYVVLHLERVPFTERIRLMDIDPRDEHSMGEKYYRAYLSEAKVLDASHFYSKKALQIGNRIASVTDAPPEYKFEFHVVVDDSVNAFCLPGGKVVVNTGLFKVCRTDSELAAVLGHEISHALLRHAAEKLSYAKVLQVVYYALILFVGDVGPIYNILAKFAFELPNSRKMELEADRMGLVLMARACFDPQAAPTMFEKLGKATEGASGNSGPTQVVGEYLSTHPVSSHRIEVINEHMAEALVIREKYCAGRLAQFGSYFGGKSGRSQPSAKSPGSEW